MTSESIIQQILPQNVHPNSTLHLSLQIDINWAEIGYYYYGCLFARKRVAHLRVASSKKCQHHPELTGAANWFQSAWKVYLVTTILVDKMVSLCAGVVRVSQSESD